MIPVVTENDRRPLSVRQAIEEPEQFVSTWKVGEGNLLMAVVLTVQIRALSAHPAHVPAGEVQDGLAQIGLEGLRIAESPQSSCYPDKCLLDDVLGKISVAHEHVSESSGSRGVLGIQLCQAPRALPLKRHLRHLHILRLPDSRSEPRRPYIQDASAPRKVPRWTAPVFVEHALTVTGLHVAFATLAQSLGFELVSWTREAKESFVYGDRQTAIVPDATLVLAAEDAEHRAFIEMDLGTMSTTRLAQKLGGYAAYARTQAGRGRHPFPPVLLFVTITEARTERVVRKFEEKWTWEDRRGARGSHCGGGEEQGRRADRKRAPATGRQQQAGARRALDRYFAFEEGSPSPSDCQERIDMLTRASTLWRQRNGNSHKSLFATLLSR